MAVEEDGRGAGRGRAVADHGVAAVRGLREVHVPQTRLGEGVGDPLGGLVALLGRVLARVGDGRDRDELGEIGLRAGHQLSYTGR